MAKTTARKAPWKRPNPRKRAGQASKHLTPAKKAAAKARAKRAGRPYPNLVDNMNMAKSTKKKTAKKAVKKATKKKTATKTSTKKTARKASTKKASKKAEKAEKDPKGDLTAAGRKALARRDGAYLKPGVTKKASEMTATEMRRKGSWAVRFYGRAKLPPLVDDQGRPTRHALSAHAWGEPVPRTVAAARKIAAKGERLLERYRKAKKSA